MFLSPSKISNDVSCCVDHVTRGARMRAADHCDHSSVTSVTNCDVMTSSVSSCYLSTFMWSLRPSKFRHKFTRNCKSEVLCRKSPSSVQNIASYKEYQVFVDILVLVAGVFFARPTSRQMQNVSKALISTRRRNYRIIFRWSQTTLAPF